MAVFDITYETSNYYTNPVREAIFELMVIPENNRDQKYISHTIQNSLGSQVQYTKALFGAQLCRFRVSRKFCSFQVSVNIKVEKEERSPFVINSLNTVAQEKILQDHDFKINHHRFLLPSLFTNPGKEKLPCETQRGKGEDPFLYMQRINNWIYCNVKYQKGVTNTQTKLDEVLKIMAGVCQDQSHLFIAIMRENGIPARYVSGYLNQGLSFTGDSAMHAWAESFVPGIGWIGFDPSNNLLANENYIKIGYGQDYTDCMPIKGVLVAKGNGFTEYSVKVIEQQTQ